MTKNLFIFPYNTNSQGARELSIFLKARRIKTEGSAYKGGKSKVVINWGCSNISNPEVLKSEMLNHPDKVSLVSNKRSFFELMSSKETEARVPDWTTVKEEARSWIVRDNKTVFARTVLNGHSGAGIIELGSSEDIDAIKDGTLFVKYVPKKDEYRIHVSALDGIFDQRRKMRSFNVPDPNWRIRNHDNGFIYGNCHLKDLPEDVVKQTLFAFKGSGLDFGAVDVIYNKKSEKAYVLEINSAPGLEGSTIEKYSTAIDRLSSAIMGKEVPELKIFTDNEPKKKPDYTIFLDK